MIELLLPSNIQDTKLDGMVLSPIEPQPRKLLDQVRDVMRLTTSEIASTGEISCAKRATNQTDLERLSDRVLRKSRGFRPQLLSDIG